LTAVDVIADTTLQTQLKVKNFDNAPATITGTFSGTVSLQAPGTDPLVAKPTDSEHATLPAFDGVVDLSGPSSHACGATVFHNTRSVSLDAAGHDLSAYVGTGSFPVTEAGTGTTAANGPGNLLSLVHTVTSASVRVIYHYTPSNALKPGNYTVVQ